MSRYRLEVPGWAPCRLNRLLGHPLKAHRLKRKDADMLARAKLVYGVPDATGPRRLRLTITQPRGRFGDPDGPLKSFLDACTTARLIVDDSARWATWEVPVFVRGPKGTVVEIEDLT